MRKRILLVNEASYLSTGFSVYGHEFLTRLFNTDKYELAEFGSYGEEDDPRWRNLPWKFYPNQPSRQDTKGIEVYNSCPTNQFGEWRFEKICLDFKPHIVVTIRDVWSDEFVERSPFRPYFKWALLAPVDSAPQDENWIATFINADAVYTYSEFGINTLNKQGSGLIKLRGIASPGANLEDFQVIADKSQHKKNFGIPEDIYIVGTIMRNQERKLYPDLIESFATFLQQAPPELAKKTYLYLHTGYPDVGWNIPSLLKQYGVLSKTLLTYVCQHCHSVFPSFYQDTVTFCKYCKQYSCIMPRVDNGISRKALNQIINLFDVYVQYSVCLPAGQQVLLQRGWTPIEDVRVGDYAFTHKNRYMPVVKTFKSVSDDIYKVKTFGDYQSIKITNNHPIYSLTKDDLPPSKLSIREQLGKMLVIPIPKFRPLSELHINDLVAYTIDDTVTDIDNIDGLDINENFCKFIGLFLADGYADFRGVRVTLSDKEIDYIAFANEELHKFNCITKIRKYIDRKAVDIYINSIMYGNKFRKLFYNKKDKVLPKWIMYLPINKQRNIIRGLFMGDGHYLSNKTTSIYVTTSSILADQLKTLLRRMRIYFNVRIAIKSGNRKPQFRFEIRGNVAQNIFSIKKTNTRGIYIDNLYYAQIKIKEKLDCTTEVYNFEVETDNSYLTKLTQVHNCEGFGIPVVEAAACGVPPFAVDYSAMADIIKNVGGYPIKVQRMFTDIRTNAKRALPENQDFINQLIEYLLSSQEYKSNKSNEVRKLTEQRYSWDNTLKTWMDCFDDMEILSPEQSWKSASRISQPSTQYPANLTNEDFVQWAIINIAGRPEFLNSYVFLKLVKDLNLGAIHTQQKLMLYNREELIKQLIRICEQKNFWEKIRLGAM